MVFSSIVFLFYFLPLFLVVFVASRFSKNALLVFSIIFYAWGEPVFVLLVVAMIVVNHRLGLMIERGHATGDARLWVTAGIIVNLIPLGVFKYGAFILDILLAIGGPLSIKLFGFARYQSGFHQLALPLGISFYTFHALSYLIDVYRKDVQAERSIRDLAVYILMFPQLIAGPIIRYKTIAGELHEPVISADRAALGIKIFVVGLAQKVLIANTVATSADAIFALPAAELSAPLAWLGVVCYTLQIYYDFGGYSLMAIGLGFIIGFTYPINFNYPYISASMTEFWRRWHISLSTWFRDYLYIPLGGNRVSRVRTYVNLWVVFLLCGLWHGAAWNFVAWGAAHGALLVLERSGFSSVLERLPVVMRHAYVLLAVMVTWVLFRADSLPAAVSYLGAMFGAGAEVSAAPPFGRFLSADVAMALIVGVAIAGPFADRCVTALGDRLRLGEINAGRLAGLVALFTLVTLSLAGGAYNPFIYFRF
jgi:alginate O-acetyltransferase complex protein AlgI